MQLFKDSNQQLWLWSMIFLVLGQQIDCFKYIDWSNSEPNESRSASSSLNSSSPSNSSSSSSSSSSNKTEQDNRPPPRNIDALKPFEGLHVGAYGWYVIRNKSDIALPIEIGSRHRWEARHSLFPSQGLIHFKEKSGTLRTCGCVLLHNDLILTSRRCLRSTVAARVVFRRYYHHVQGGAELEQDKLLQKAFVKGFCVTQQGADDGLDVADDVAVGLLDRSFVYDYLTKPAALLLGQEEDKEQELVQCVGVIREDPFNGYNLLRKGCSGTKLDEKDRSCYTSTTEGSRHPCRGVDEGMGLYCLTRVNALERRGTWPRHWIAPQIYLCGLLTAAEQSSPNCGNDTGHAEQYAYYADFKKISKFKDMITRCHE